MRKSILLIGGSHGIGFEIALKLYSEHTIYIASRTSENLGSLEVTHIPYDAKDEIDTSLLPERMAKSSYDITSNTYSQIFYTIRTY